MDYKNDTPKVSFIQPEPITLANSTRRPSLRNPYHNQKELPWFLVLALWLGLSGCSPKTPPPNSSLYGTIDHSVQSFDPIFSDDTYKNQMISQVFEGLYHYHYLKRPLTIEPLLAAEMPRISKDGLTYTIKIKKNIPFHNHSKFPKGKGRMITAHDFVYSWKRLADPKINSPGLWVFNKKIKGLNTWREKIKRGHGTFATPVAGLTALDDFTLEIQLEKPFASFLSHLTLPYTYVVPREIVKHYGREFGRNPVGTGPFLIDSWVPESKLVFKKNPSYNHQVYPSWGAEEDKALGLLTDANQPLPLSDKIIIKMLKERQPSWLEFKKGQLDFISLLPKNGYEELFRGPHLSEDFKNNKVKVYQEARMDTLFLGFNLAHPLLGSNKLLRKAIVHGFNLPLYLKTFYSNRGQPAQGPVPPQLRPKSPLNAIPFHLPYDPILAKKLLKQAGFPNGKGLPTLRFELTNEATVARQIGEFFKLQMASIGIPVKLVGNSWASFSRKLKEKKADIFTMAWSADFPDAENFLQLYYSKNISPGPNMCNFSNRSYDRLLEKYMITPLGRDRDALYFEMIEILRNEVPSAFLIHRLQTTVYHHWLKNYKKNSTIFDNLKYLKISGRKK